MIVVNLLPFHLRPIKRTPIPYILSVALALVALGGCASLFLANFSKQLDVDSQIAAANAEYDSLKETVEEYNQLEQKKIALADKVAVIQEILEGRKIWSEHLHRLAELTPKNIWFSQIRLTTVSDKEIVPKIDPKTQKQVINAKTKLPETVVQTVKRPVLEVSGYIINDEQGRANLYQLLNNTSADPSFSQHFEIFSPDIVDTEFEGFMVRSFTLQYLIKSTPAGGTA